MELAISRGTGPLRSITPAIDIYIKLAQYPILSDRIRVRMREELFRRGVIDPDSFEQEVKEKALESQRREGLYDPFDQEQANLWQKRKERIRTLLTDAYFANNLGVSLLEQLIEEVLDDQPGPTGSVELTFDPEIAPFELLFRQGEIYESLPPQEQEKVSHHLEEIKVVLIKSMISEQLQFIAVAKKVFSIADLRRIYRRRIGGGKIGGKAAGMILAWKILQQPDLELPDISDAVSIPDSYFIGSEVIYDFRLMNNLDSYMNLKYRPLEEIRAEYPRIVEAHLQGRFPEEIVDQLRDVLTRMGNSPLIVRSSSLLEDSFGYSFAGKYSSYFCPNQGSEKENLQGLLNAIRRVYASTVNPDAILYRQHHGLIDYDERMAILLQKVQGHQFDHHFMPMIAGVGLSQNPFIWQPKIRREDGFLRIVWGMGTRATGRKDNNYTRLIALSHPHLRPEKNAKEIWRYSQHHVDLVDLADNRFKSKPVIDVIGTEEDNPMLRYIASVDEDYYPQDVLGADTPGGNKLYVLTFDYLTKDQKFINLMQTTLKRLEKAYSTPVDIEFTVEIVPNHPYPDYKLHLLQCRPLSQRAEADKVTIPENIPEEDVLFTSQGLVPDGKAEGIRYVIFIDPENYRQIADRTVKLELGRAIGRLNKRLEDEAFILIGPGRWGSSNIDLGVHVTYADIYNTKVLIEMSVAHDGTPPELSYGTHFFQDLVESGIYSLPLHLHNESSHFNWTFFRQSPNVLTTLLQVDTALSNYLRVIDIAAVCGNRRLRILMDGSGDEAIGYLAAGAWETA